MRELFGERRHRRGITAPRETRLLIAVEITGLFDAHDERPSVSDHYVYVLECDDGTYYTGYTTDLKRRVDEHDAGEGAKYTRGRTPVSLVHAEAFDSRSNAMSREHEIKTYSRARKADLVASDAGIEP